MHRADDVDQPRYLPSRASFRILPAFGNEAANEAAIDHHDFAVGRREHPIAGTGYVGAESRERSEDQGFLGIIERGAEGDAAVFVALPVELRSSGGSRQSDRRRRDPRIQRGDQSFLPGLALDLPDAQPDRDGEGQQRRHQKPEPRPTPMTLPRRAFTRGRFHLHGHDRSAPPKRLSAALWWYCNAIISPFIGRSGPSVRMKISGSHSTAWTQ